MKRRAALVMLLVLASGCALNQSQYRLVEPGVRAIDGVYRVDSKLAWSSLPNGGKVETWTRDGLSLDSLRFFKGIADGETMLAERANDVAAARFRASMTPVETVEFVVDSLYGSPFTPRNVRPARFGRAEGFRFEISYWRRDGLKRDALVAGATIKRRLQIIVFDGTSLYHFERYRLEIEHMLESISLIDA